MSEYSELKILLEQKKYAEVVSRCTKLIDSDIVTDIQALRIRAKAFALSGNLVESIQDYKDIFETSDGSIQDYYLAAYYAFEADEFEESERWFREVIVRGEIEKENWFETATFFYLCYLTMEMKRFEEASMYIDKALSADANVALPLPAIGAVCSGIQLKEELFRRMK